MIVTRRRLLLWALGLALIAVAVGGSGLVPIGASGGHWAITDWLLHSAMRRSVKTHAAGIDTPPLDDPALVRRGAGHFETGCAPCHGSPARGRGAVASSMTPPPPDLGGRIAHWRPRELFWIVKHGVKFTGMPAWPTQMRDDEVWAMTAFLRRMPGMPAAAYTELAYGDADPAEAGALSVVARRPLADCARCHGRDGVGDRNGAFPRLDIQTRAYLLAALRSFADGSRASGIMAAAVAGLSDQELTALADHYAGTPVAPFSGDAMGDSRHLTRGEAIATVGIPAQRIPPCASCHGPPSSRPRVDFPRLSGQYRSYLRDQLRLFANEAERGGTRFRNLMTTFAHALQPDDIEAVAAWYAARQPATRE